MDLYRRKGVAKLGRAVMPFVASLSTLSLCAAYIYACTMEVDWILRSVLRALPAEVLAALILYQRWEEFCGDKSESEGYSMQKQYFHLIGFGLVFMGIGDALIQMEEHPVYKTKLYFLAGMIM